MLTLEQDQRLREIIAETLGVENTEIDDNASPQTVSQWTSIRHLTLMISIEEEFGITFSMEEMTGAQSFSDLQRIVGEHIS